MSPPPVIDPSPRRRIAALVVALVLAAAVRLVLSDASIRRDARSADDDMHRAAARVMNAPDLMLSASSRWLRHPSLTESGAAFSDGPACLDMDPAGGAIAPPREILSHGAFGGEPIVRRRSP